MSKKVTADNFSGAVMEIFETYSAEVQESVDEAVREVANESRSDLKVAGDFKNRSGDYRKGWKITFDKKRYGLEATIHNKLYQLTHLLESGHAKFLWGRPTGETVKAFPHIENVNEEAHKRLEEEIVRRVK